MFKSLRSRILFSILFVVSFTTFVTMFFVRREVEEAVYTAQNQNAINLVNTVVLNVENSYYSIKFHEEQTLKSRKYQLKNTAELAHGIIKGYYQKYQEGIFDEEDAKKYALEAMEKFRYDHNIGYIWINNTDKPFPRMLMHPTLPELNDKILDHKKFNCALGTEKNLFVAAVEVCLEKDHGFIDYLWPKPTDHGLTKEQPKISFVKIFKEWNWIIGTGVYVDDVEKEKRKRLDAVIKELKTNLSKVTFSESGYMYIFNGQKKFLIHPLLEGRDGDVLINPATGNKLLDELIKAYKKPGKKFEYIWNKPTIKDEYRFKKRAYIRYFEPLDWYVVSTVYIDDIKKPALILARKIMLLFIIFLLVSVFFTFFLANSLTKPIRKLMSVAKDIKEKGVEKLKIPKQGTIETQQLGQILEDMIISVQNKESQLRQAQKMETVGTLAGGLAHDFNNVLGGITGSVTLIENKLKRFGNIEVDKLKYYINIINKCCDRSSNMVQQLLALSKKQDLNLNDVDLNKITNDVVQICKSTFKKSIDIIFMPFPGIAVVSADSNQIEQILLNICINAEHAMTIMKNNDEEWGGNISLEIDAFKADEYFCVNHPDAEQIDYFQLSVKDTGVGIDKDNLNKIFNPFFTTKKQEQGTGLGLSMAYNIIKQHNGFIDVYSEKNLGTTFNIYLPKLSSSLDNNVIETERNDIEKGEGLILVVDDEQVLREIAEDILSSIGYDVLTAENGLEGLNLFKKHYKDIKAVLLDMAMPEMSGKIAFNEMKKIDPNVKVVLASGFRQDHRIDDIINDGVISFLNKPYTFNKLNKAIGDAIHHSKNLPD